MWLFQVSSTYFENYVFSFPCSQLMQLLFLMVQIKCYCCCCCCCCPWDKNFIAWDPRRGISLLEAIVIFATDTRSACDFAHPNWTNVNSKTVGDHVRYKLWTLGDHVRYTWWTLGDHVRYTWWSCEPTEGSQRRIASRLCLFVQAWCPLSTVQPTATDWRAACNPRESVRTNPTCHSSCTDH